MPNSAGMLPLNWLAPRLRVVKLDRLPNSAGTLPLNWLAPRLRVVKLDRLPNSAGMLPLNWLANSSRKSTWPALQNTPCQLHGVSVTSHPGSFVQLGPSVLLNRAIKALHSTVGISETFEQTSIVTDEAAENSDVLPSASVAVEVMNRPRGTAVGKVTEELVVPPASVITLVEPRKFSPSPNPDGSATVFEKNSPFSPFPEMTLWAPGALPPIVLLRPLETRMPSPALPMAAMPATSVPMKLPSMTLPPFVSNSTLCPAKRLMTRPRTVLFPTLKINPLAKSPALVPSTSIFSMALLPSPRGFVLGLDPGWVYPSMTTGSVMVGKADNGWMVCGPGPERSKWMASWSGLAFVAVIASRRVHSVRSQTPSPGSAAEFTSTTMAGDSVT